MRDVPLESVAFHHLEALRDNGVGENRHLEFKQDLPLNWNDDAKREFLADVSCFANADGGDVVYGIEEAKDENGKNTGLIDSFKGITATNADDTERHLRDILSTGLAPKLPKVDFRFVPMGTGHLLVVRVGRSLIAPHEVTFKNYSRFYARHGAKKEQMDVRELREAFLESSAAVARARQFRERRLTALFDLDSMVCKHEGPLVCMHVIPVGGLRSGERDIVPKQPWRGLPLLVDGGYSVRYNLDGVVSISNVPHERPSYVQVFREGAIEAVDGIFLGWRPAHERYMPSHDLERLLVRSAGTYALFLRGQGVDAPLALSVTFLRVRGFSMGVDTSNLFVRDLASRVIDRDSVLLPEVLIEGDSVTAEMLKPMFDVMWQAAGWEQSRNFDEQGKWKLALT